MRTRKDAFLAYWPLALALLVGPAPAWAGDGSPAHVPRRQYVQASPSERAGIGSTATLVPFGSMTAIIIWRSPEALDDGIALAKANASTMEVLPLVSCIVDSGSKVVIMDQGEWDRYYLVTVSEGPRAGCQGAVLSLNVRR